VAGQQLHAIGPQRVGHELGHFGVFTQHHARRHLDLRDD
jgi:hypothetical protein